MTPEEFTQIRETIPTEPGVYRYLDAAGKVLYVGKAKNIQKRVSQYFVETRTTAARIRMLVRLIDKIEFSVVANESDALILENSLIKTFQPKYNIRLKDDKTYPFIVIKNEEFPRVYFTRSYVKDGSEYLGPYTSVFFAKEIFSTIKAVFPLRTCKLNLTPENIAKKKFKVCLEYHLGNCAAPCVGLQSAADYALSIKRIREILKGKFGEIKQYMMSQMESSAEQLNFEQAEKWKLKVQKLRDFESKSVIFNPSLHHIMAINLYEANERKVLNYLKIENGMIVSAKNIEVETKLGETKEEILHAFLETFLLENPEIKEVLLPFEIEPLHIKMTLPLLGDKKNLLALSYQNARSYAMSLIVDPKYQRKRNEFNVLKELQDKLHLKELPVHIECFDNSNIQGTNPVSACVVFKNGKPSKKDYRHFHIKSVEGPDDFESMKEVVYRRYKRMIEEGETLPQLIVVDGGKGQLSHALESLKELGIEDRVPMVGIAKRLEEIYFKDDPIPLYIDKKSPALKLIQQMRDEAHRFGITFHRQLRSKKMAVSQFEGLDGFGAKTIQKLYTQFKSIENMKGASLEELKAVVGQKRAEQLVEYFSTN